MNTNKHTPTPWYFSPISCDVWANPGFTICEVYPSGHETEEKKANAEFIVRAVNCHDELVEALQRLRNAEKAPRQEWVDALASADIALTKAGKGEG